MIRFGSITTEDYGWPKVTGTIVSRAHDWLALLPIADSNIICTRCGITTKIGHWHIRLCIEHHEKDTSDFIPHVQKPS